MIKRYTIKFAPAVNQNELEKALYESGETPIQNIPDLKRMKARIEVVGHFEDQRVLVQFLSELSRKVGVA